MRMVRGAQAAVRTIVAAFAIVVCSFSMAEVAVSFAPNNSESNAIRSGWIAASVIEDPDPVTIEFWGRIQPDGPTRAALNDQGTANGDGPPSMLTLAADNLAVVVWSRNAGSDFDVVISQFVEGTWTAPLVLAGSAYDEMDPHVFRNPDNGSIHVVYWIDDAYPAVYHREAPADLSSWSPPVQVSAPGEIALRPHGTFHDGEMRVVFEGHALVPGGTPRQILLASLDEGAFVSELLATTGSDVENRPMVHSMAGRLWVDWVDDEGTMTWRRMDSQGAWGPIAAEPFATFEAREFHVRGVIRHKALE